MRNIPISDNTLIYQAVSLLTSLLPKSWSTGVILEPNADDWRSDAHLELTAPDGTKITFVLEAKRRLEPNEVANLTSQLPLYNQSYEKQKMRILTVSFLSTRTQDRLVQSGLNYIDLTGNMRIAVDHPALFIRTNGAQRNPWREERPSRSFRGAAAGRVVRALCDYSPPVRVRELASRAKTDPGWVSRLLVLLERDDLIDRDSTGRVTNVDWQGLILRWTDDYHLLESNRPNYYLEPRGLPALLKKLRDSDFRYAITGSLGAERVAPVAPARLAVCYVDNPEQVAADLNLRPSETGANAILAEPFDPVVYERTWERDGLTFAALSQIAADLLTSPGRGPAEAEALMAWMSENGYVW